MPKPAANLLVTRIVITLFAVALFFTGHAQRQKSDPISLSINEANMYGYVEGIRLDSVPGKFLVLETREFSGVHFINPHDVDFGQQRPSLSNSAIKTSDGQTITFNGAATLLNFFDFNGWQLNRVITSPAFNMMVEIIFEKKK